jgi:DNA-binding NtrC family response regulator
MISNNPHLPLGSSPCIVRVRELLQQVSAYMTNVLITGESGTGKEWAALYLHSLSLRSGKAFVPINCGAIPPDLLEVSFLGMNRVRSRVP